MNTENSYCNLFEEAKQKVLEDINASVSIRQLRLQALADANRLILSYGELIRSDIINQIFKAKIAFILEANTKKEIKEILKPSISKYDGNKYVPSGKYHIPAEELVILCNTSMIAPLSYEATKRVKELCQLVLGDEIKKIWD